MYTHTNTNRKKNGQAPRRLSSNKVTPSVVPMSAMLRWSVFMTGLSMTFCLKPRERRTLPSGVSPASHQRCGTTSGRRKRDRMKCLMGKW